MIYGGIKNLKNKCDHLLNFISVAAYFLSNAENAGGHVPKKAFLRALWGSSEVKRDFWDPKFFRFILLDEVKWQFISLKLHKTKPLQ